MALSAAARGLRILVAGDWRAQRVPLAAPPFNCSTIGVCVPASHRIARASEVQAGLGVHGSYPLRSRPQALLLLWPLSSPGNTWICLFLSPWSAIIRQALANFLISAQALKRPVGR